MVLRKYFVLCLSIVSVCVGVLHASISSSIAHVNVPQHLSLECRRFIQMQNFFDDLNKQPGLFTHVEQMVQLDGLQSNSEMAHDALLLLLNHALYHRPFNFERACQNIDSIVNHFPLVKKALDKELCDVGLGRLIDAPLKGHQRLFLRALASNYSFGGHILVLYCCESGDFIAGFFRDAFWKKLMIMMSLCIHVVQANCSAFVSFESFGECIDVLMRTKRCKFVEEFFVWVQCLSLSLEIAIFDNDIDFIIESGVFNKYTSEKESLLGYSYISLAAFAGAASVFDYLVQDISSIDSTVFLFAIIGGNNDILYKCVYKGGAFNWIDAFHYAVAVHRNDLADWIRGLHPRMVMDDQVEAVMLDNWHYFEWLQQDSKVEKKTSVLRNISLLHVAAASGSVLVGRMLIDQGCDINDLEFGKTPLMIAIEHNQVHFVKFLLDHGADVSLENPDTGESALFSAVQAGNLVLAGLLLAHGADVNKANFNNETPLYVLTFVMRNVINASLNMHQKLVGYGYNTPLVREVLSQDYWGPDFFIRLVGLLLSQNADVNIATFLDKRTPLHNAVIMDNIPLVVFLVDCKSMVNNVDNEGKTPLWYAIKNGNLVLVNYLQKHGACLGID